MTTEFTEKEKKALALIAVKDEWDIDLLERTVRNIMFDGVSFGRAVITALARAERPESGTEKTSEQLSKEEKVKALARKVVELREKMLEDFNLFQRNKNGNFNL